MRTRDGRPSPTLSATGQAALRYAVEFGWRVMPDHEVHNGLCSCGDPSCEKPGKHPRIAEWPTKASSHPDTIASWWTRWPSANVGILCGAASGIVVLDCDGPEGTAALQRLGGLSEPTVAQRTGRDGGEHYLFQHPGVPIQSGTALAPHLDIRADGGQIVAAPSRHASGRAYRWVEGREPGVIPLAPLPPRLLEVLLAKSPGSGNGARAAAAPLPEVIADGQRNDTLTSLAGTMRRRGASEAAILAALREENATRCDPPLDDAELAEIAGSIGGYAPAAEIPGAVPAPEPFPVVRALEGAAPEPPAVLVPELVVDRDITLLAGFGGGFKSVIALVIAVCVALGRAVFDTLEVRRSGPVLLVCPEDGQAAVRMMLDAIIEGLRLGAGHRAILAAQLVMLPDDATLNLLTDTRRLGRTARDCGAVLVVIDPLRNVLGGADENDNGTAAGCLDALRRDVCRGAGAAVLMSHHARKPGKDAGPDNVATVHEMRGAGAWAAGARLVWHIANKAGDVTLSAVKANRLRSDLRHELRVTIEADSEMPTRWRSVVVTDANAGARSDALTPGVGRELNANERTALECLDDHDEPGKRLSWSRWRDDSGLNPNTFRSIKTRLLSAQLVAAISTGRKNRNGGPDYSYAITDAGRHAVRYGWVNEPPSGEGVTSGE